MSGVNSTPSFIKGGKKLPTAFMLINTEICAEGKVLEKVRKIENVEEAFQVYGVYDLVVKVKAKTEDELKEIEQKIRKIDEVRVTLTMVTMEK
jgi:Lrp/AsnC family transcriptional regulator for asnA, asnC and gidA